MPTITLNRVPAPVAKEIKRISGSRSAYVRAALAEKLSRDGRADLAKLLQKKATP